MMSNYGNVGHPPFFYDSNFDYWKTSMRIHLKAMSGNLWKVVDEGYVILNVTNLTQMDNDNLLMDA
jgi:hypothetical protein